MTLLSWVVGTATLWAAAFAVYGFAVRARWLSRFENGFLFEIAFALVGIALMSASVVGVWGYQAAGQILDDETGRRDAGYRGDRRKRNRIGDSMTSSTS